MSRWMATALSVGAAALFLLGAVALHSGLDSLHAPPAPAPSVPKGVSVERVGIGGRTVWCAINYNGGISCDFTKEAS